MVVATVLLAERALTRQTMSLFFAASSWPRSGMVWCKRSYLTGCRMMSARFVLPHNRHAPRSQPTSSTATTSSPTPDTPSARSLPWPRLDLRGRRGWLAGASSAVGMRSGCSVTGRGGFSFRGAAVGGVIDPHSSTIEWHHSEVTVEAHPSGEIIDPGIVQGILRLQ